MNARNLASCCALEISSIAPTGCGLLCRELAPCRIRDALSDDSSVSRVSNAREASSGLYLAFHLTNLTYRK